MKCSIELLLGGGVSDLRPGIGKTQFGEKYHSAGESQFTWCVLSHLSPQNDEKKESKFQRNALKDGREDACYHPEELGR